MIDVISKCWYLRIGTSLYKKSMIYSVVPRLFQPYPTSGRAPSTSPRILNLIYKNYCNSICTKLNNIYFTFTLLYYTMTWKKNYSRFSNKQNEDPYYTPMFPFKVIMLEYTLYKDNILVKTTKIILRIQLQAWDNAAVILEDIGDTNQVAGATNQTCYLQIWLISVTIGRYTPLENMPNF